MIDWMNETAKTKFNLPNNWRWCRSEAIPGGLLLEGNTTHINRNNKTVWGKPLQKFIITDEDIKKCKINYEKETGKCSICEGTGQHNYGWHHIKGPIFKLCEECNGTGISQVP